jgi:hypothetical protein
MDAASTDREHVIKVLEGLKGRFDLEKGTPPSTGVNPVEAAKAAAQIRDALHWMHHVEPGLVAEDDADDLRPGAEYVSNHPVVSMVQSEIARAGSGEKKAATTAGGGGGLGFLGSVIDALIRGRAPFPRHQSLQDFRFELPTRCRVALVSDWGTGKPGAIEVMRRIAEARPQHLIHLGDIYHAGRTEEVHDHFISILREHGPPECQFWAMNGNHEMNSGGHAYFGEVLPFCGQPASYFALGNTHWRLVALDTAYEEYRLRPPQLDWVAHLLVEEGPKNILLTHHQVFSAVDGRPGRHHTDIHLGPLAEPGNVFAWFWGHEHRCLIYDQDPKRGGMRARCIGHGGKEEKLPGMRKRKHPSPPVLEHWELADPADPERMMNGFALLDFDGPTLDVSYIAESGFVWFGESWRADG